ncbi:MAG: phosphoribosylanthranilate isomerase [Candidatus Omnitrophica bacterium]|nr:phosphoribosylanthranilate isomerase [Candidatus Omnitrophota bacterium]
MCSRVKIKICGITNLEDAIEAIEAGCDALGFIFYRKSPRYISEAKAIQIINWIPKRIKKVGVFVNEKEMTIKKIADFLKLDILQLHGDESADFCNRFKDYKVIKAIRVRDKSSLNNIDRYPVWGVLFDKYESSLFGGTGKVFDWSLLKNIELKDKVFFLSGGLNINNVRNAIRTLHPDWVDASSSLEKAPGEKDSEKVKAFIKIVRETKL